jgi:ribosomal 50S subunit-recycling heat shock protein
VRFDVLLADLHLFKSRSQARLAIEAGEALLNGARVKPSHGTRAGDRVTLVTSRGERTVELLDLPRASMSKQAARELLREI